MNEGIIDPVTGKFTKFSLNEAAKMVGVLRKSLDDYFLMIKQAISLGFDLKKNQHHGFGVLRAFVRKDKEKATHSDSARYDNEDQSSIPAKCTGSKKIRKNTFSL